MLDDGDARGVSDASRLWLGVRGADGAVTDRDGVNGVIEQSAVMLIVHDLVLLRCVRVLLSLLVFGFALRLTLLDRVAVMVLLRSVFVWLMLEL